MGSGGGGKMQTMAFTVQELKDLLDLLEQHPEWKSVLRASLLGEEILRLPELVRQIAGEVQALTEAQRRTDQRLAELAEAQRHTERQLQELVGAHKQLEQRVAVLEDRVGDLLGRDLERQYRERAHAYFQRILKAVRLPDLLELQQALDEAVRAGRITEDEKYDLLLADVLVQGRYGDQEAYLVVEVSGELRLHDVDRAARRAEILRRATGVLTVAAVAGRRFAPGAAEAEARKQGVWRVLDGVALPPGG